MNESDLNNNLNGLIKLGGGGEWQIGQILKYFRIFSIQCDSCAMELEFFTYILCDMTPIVND